MEVCEWRYRGSLDDWSLGLGNLLLLLAGQLNMVMLLLLVLKDHPSVNLGLKFDNSKD